MAMAAVLEGAREFSTVGRLRLLRREVGLLDAISPGAHRDPNHMALSRRRRRPLHRRVFSLYTAREDEDEDQDLAGRGSRPDLLGSCLPLGVSVPKRAVGAVVAGCSGPKWEGGGSFFYSVCAYLPQKDPNSLGGHLRFSTLELGIDATVLISSS